MVDQPPHPILFKSRQGSSLFTDKRGIRPRTAAAKIFINKQESSKPVHRPQSCQLVAVKHSLYHPRLPTLRQMDRDTVIHRLSDEHSRHTTHATSEEFQMCATSPQELPLIQIRKHLDGLPPSQSEIPPCRDWRLLVTRQEGEEPPLLVRGYVPRILPYDVTSSWKFSLKEGPEIDYETCNSKPIPATLYSRYRGTWASTATTHSRPWK